MNHTTLHQYLDAQTSLDAPLRPLLLSVAQSCARISRAVAQGALGGVLGSLGSENVQGEVQKKLDVLANDLMLENNERCGSLTAMASEEMDTLYAVPHEHPQGPYLLLFDPLDGSSNIDVNVSIGTIFSVLRAPQDSTIQEADFLQKGDQQVAAGYAVYGPQTMLVLTLGQGVVGFTLSPDTQEWLLTHPNITLPEDTAEFAINMSNMRHWEPPVQRYIQDCLAGETGVLGKNYNMRWIASMVADVHRILMRGGLFMYPRDSRASGKKGKLRLMYEANPMSLLIEQAGGVAIDGHDRLLDIAPTELHQRVGVILGSRNEVDLVMRYHQED